MLMNAARTHSSASRTIPTAGHRQKRGRNNAIAELTVLGGVPDLARHIAKVERRRGGENLGALDL
jgi:hypothetical protein